MSVRQGNNIIAGGNEIDPTPTSGSSNPVASGGVYTALAGKVSTGHEVIEFQEPTSANNYTWYRKYADGWVEQGGVTSGGTYNSPATITMPITMNDTNYCLVLGVNGQNQYSTTCAWKNKTTTTFEIENGYNGSNAAARITNWQVSGLSAN